MKYRIGAAVLLILGALLSYFIFYSHKYPFRLGLDLAGGVQLLYTADTTSVPSGEVSGAMDSLRDVIERRVNLFGVSEPVVQVQRGGALRTGTSQLLVELPGVTDINKAIELIGKTPVLEFKLFTDKAINATNTASLASSTMDELFKDTGLTGRYLKRADIIFNPNTNQPVISLQFNDEGGKLFAQITEQNINKPLAIFLDGNIISSPVIREPIRDGKAQISGQFTIAEAQTLVRNLNYGALPLPIVLSSTESIGPSLGAVAVRAGIFAGLLGAALLAAFLILWYRLPGFIAVVALALYTLLSLAAFRFIPVTLTAAGIAGFILSVGMAVDANILIFERVKEELKKGKNIHDALHEGFHRAWLSIRDSNVSSMITAITASRTFLYAIAPKKQGSFVRFLFSNGLHIK